MGRALYTDGCSSPRKPANSKAFTLKEIQEIVGGYIEAVRIPDSAKTMWVNEDGRNLELLPNLEASNIAGRSIVGNVLITNKGETH